MNLMQRGNKPLPVDVKLSVRAFSRLNQLEYLALKMTCQQINDDPALPKTNPSKFIRTLIRKNKLVSKNLKSIKEI